MTDFETVFDAYEAAADADFCEEPDAAEKMSVFLEAKAAYERETCEPWDPEPRPEQSYEGSTAEDGLQDEDGHQAMMNYYERDCPAAREAYEEMCRDDAMGRS
jgi:hypothetical protein